MTCSIFIASTTATGWSFRTASPSATWMATIRPWMGDATPSEPSGPVSAGCVRRNGRLLGLDRGVVREQGQRIAAFDARTGKSGVARRRPRRFHEALALRQAGRQHGDVLVNPSCMHIAAGEIRMREDVAQEWNVGGDTLQPELAECPGGAAYRDGEIRSGRMHDHLGQKGVEGGARLVARVAEAVRAYAWPIRRIIDGQRAAAGQNSTVRADGFHVNAGLNRITARTRRGVTT